MAERSPDETDADVDAERTVDELETGDDEPGGIAPRPIDPDADADAERVVDTDADDLYPEQPDLGDFEGNLNA